MTPPTGPSIRTVARAASRGREQAPLRAAVTVLLVVAFVVSAVLALTVVRGAWTEAPGEAGSWSVDLGRELSPGADAVAEQIRSMQRVAGATAALVSLLSLMSLTGLLRQRSRLRRPEDRVHWAMGSSRMGFAARWVGEGWRTGAVAGTLSLAAGIGLPAVLAATFPGAADAPPSLFWTSLLLVLLGCSLLQRARGTGTRAARGVDGGWGRLLTLPASVAAPGFAALVGVGLLGSDAAGPTGPDSIQAGDRMVLARLNPLPPALRGPALASWAGRIGGSVGMASSGTVRGAGRRGTVWVDCGSCSVGGLPLPVRTVEAELHALPPDTFSLLGVDILQGRDFRADDAGDQLTAAVVSRSLAVRHFQNGQAVGRRIRFGEGGWIEVVGVVEDRWDIRDPDEFAVYLPLLQARPDAVELFEAGGPPGLGEALMAMPPGIRVEGPRAVRATFAAGRWFRTILSALATLALMVAVAGIWMGARAEMKGRSGELALRRGLGAAPRHLWRHWLAFVAELERSFGLPPILDARIWLSAALPLLAAFVAGALPPFLSARRGAPAARMEGVE